MERIGGKSNLLAKNQVFKNDPNHYLKSEQRITTATSKQVVSASNKWLSDGEYVLRVLPYPNFSAKTSTVDRSIGLPELSEAPEVRFDDLQKTSLSNGLKVIFAKRSAVPVIKMRMMIDSGFAADQNGKPGTANLTMQMLDEGTQSMDSLEISGRLAELGTQLSSSAGLDVSTVRLNTLKDKLDPSLAIFADVILNPTFPANQLERLKQEQLVAISQEKSSPFGIGFRVLPSLLYGKEHAYSGPFSGSGDESSVQSMQVEDLKQYHQSWFKANNATLVVVGDTNLEELTPKLEKAFSGMPAGKTPEKNIADVAAISKPAIYLIDRPDSEQSAIIAAKLLPKYGFEGELPMQLANEILGGSFSARINMNLREDKGWAYGAWSSISNTQGQRPLLVRTSVQTDKTAESMQEIFNELNGLVTNNPASADELARSLDKRTLTLPGRWETASAVESDIARMVRFNLSDDYWDKYVSKLRNINLEQVNDLATQQITPNNMVWLIIGDVNKIEENIRNAGIADVTVINPK